jgi:hypothetical protein
MSPTRLLAAGKTAYSRHPASFGTGAPNAVAGKIASLQCKRDTFY